jgi:hypothetical protein
MQYRPVPAPTGPPLTLEEKVALANRVFHEWFARCFWSWNPSAVITERDLPQVIQDLRANGGHAGYRIAAQLCR